MKSISAICLGMAVLLGSVTATAAPVTSEISHKIMRSDGSHVSKGDRHEFYGGSHLYFKSLAEKKTTEDKKALIHLMLREGWTRLMLDWPTRLHSIVIHKASVGKDSFKGGYIIIQVQTVRGKWITVLEQKDRDIDSPLRIEKKLKHAGPIKGAQIKFRTPYPIRIGPIDLNG